MTSLLDIGPLTEIVKIGDKDVDVRGVTPEGFFYLLSKFPMLRELMDPNSRSGLTIEALRETAPNCIAYALAVATTDRTQFSTTAAWIETVEKASAIAVNLSAHHQIKIFQAALGLTFPEGTGPFMEAMDNLAKSITRVSGKGQGTTSSKPLRSGLTMDGSRGMRLGRGRPSASSAH